MVGWICCHLVQVSLNHAGMVELEWMSAFPERAFCSLPLHFSLFSVLYCICMDTINKAVASENRLFRHWLNSTKEYLFLSTHYIDCCKYYAPILVLYVIEAHCHLPSPLIFAPSPFLPNFLDKVDTEFSKQASECSALIVPCSKAPPYLLLEVYVLLYVCTAKGPRAHLGLAVHILCWISLSPCLSYSVLTLVIFLFSSPLLKRLLTFSLSIVFMQISNNFKVLSNALYTVVHKVLCVRSKYTRKHIN